MTRALYVRPSDVFKNTFIQADLDDDKLIPFIESAQDLIIQNLLGQTFYERIDQLIFDARQSTPVTTNGNIDQPLFSNYKGLINNHLKRTTEQYSASLYLRYGGYTASNKGIFKYSAANSQPADDADVSRLARQISEKGEFYAERMYDFLCQNAGLFPEWNQTELNDLPPAHQQYNYGFISF